MFESAELGHKIGKKAYDVEAPVLREALLSAQLDLFESKKFEMIILVGGVDGAGKGETVNALNEWMDARLIDTNAMDTPTDEEKERPPMWRFWRALPAKGRIGIFFGSWYTAPIVDNVTGKTDKGDLQRSIDEICRFESMLADEGALILKFWMHLSKSAQKKRLKELEKDPKLSWKVSKLDWQRFKMYDRFRSVSEHVLRLTSAAQAPWVVVEGLDTHYRHLTVGNTILKAVRERLDQVPAKPEIRFPRPLPPIDDVRILHTLDQTRKLGRKQYHEELIELQGRLNILSRSPKLKKRAVVSVFEGSDAAGKGGAIRRITAALDARFYKVIPIAAPSDVERAHPYLWRFWQQLPRLGHMTIFDRSWYGRVLVERVEGFAAEADWLRAYREINDFEAEIVRHGTILLKFWMSTSQEEQLRRFKEREKTGYKRFKLTEEDWRNRKKWDDYIAAACDMVDRTSTECAPWTLVEANDKPYARIKILRTLCETIEKAIT